ncbi:MULTISPECIES: GLPGLI family protein [unclassified Polaribacter]|uniref:GLPGLI family protein n=1 Tax=unclassified Polaribacter TaxID=196858 RepID=UPI0011BE2729|nr:MULTISPECIES: GLPGLI family protein [unclassified Polaribacter]TXD54448.1 GLPGLI family protein [Polaribacter sp. IC063]TXD60361.1 GLPGLI family protein [Polaribacter sp. IC066]
MKLVALKPFLFIALAIVTLHINAQKISGKATYISKSKMELGSWGATLSEAAKKDVAARLKNRLEKTYFLTFNNQESSFLEEEKIDAISGATDSWGGYFSRGDHYKNIKEQKLVQSQEFYGKRFLVKDELYKIDWTMGTETKKIGQYTCYRAKAFVPAKELNWFDFSWGDLAPTTKKEGDTENLTLVEAWYTPQIPVTQGPAEYWGLPGLILEVSVNNTTLLCIEVELNKDDKIAIQAPEKGKEITKKEYTLTVREKMLEMRSNRMGRRG